MTKENERIEYKEKCEGNAQQETQFSPHHPEQDRNLVNFEKSKLSRKQPAQIMEMAVPFLILQEILSSLWLKTSSGEKASILMQLVSLLSNSYHKHFFECSAEIYSHVVLSSYRSWSR